jgi:hypothetical protein
MVVAKLDEAVRAFVALGTLITFSAACAEPARPAAPPAASPRDPVTPAPPAPAPPVPAEPWPAAPPFPALARPGEVYSGPDTLYHVFHASHSSRLASRYVLYADGTFVLQFSSVGSGLGEYRGRYARADARVTFDWDGWSTAGPWGATGTLRGDTLRVTYNDVMHWSDFIDGVYVRAPDAP